VSRNIATRSSHQGVACLVTRERRAATYFPSLYNSARRDKHLLKGPFRSKDCSGLGFGKEEFTVGEAGKAQLIWYREIIIHNPPNILAKRYHQEILSSPRHGKRNEKEIKERVWTRYSSTERSVQNAEHHGSRLLDHRCCRCLGRKGLAGGNKGEKMTRC